MASKHQGGLGRGFGEFFQPSAPVGTKPVEATPDGTVTEADTDAATLTRPSGHEDAAGRTPEETETTGSSTDSHADQVTGSQASEPVHGQGDAAPEEPHRDGWSQTEGTELVDGSRLQSVAVNKIHPNPRQPRRTFDEEALLELSESIAEVGLLQPIVVRPEGDSYELVMGERRWRATRLAGLERIPAIVRTTESKDLLRDALLENLHRAQLNPLEEAAAYRQLLDDFECTQDELSRRIKRSRSQIANTLRLMRLPRPVQRHLIDGYLTAGHARALLGAKDAEDQVSIAEKIVDEGLSVRATETLVKSVNDSKTTVKPHIRRKPGSDEVALQLATRLADVYDTEVKVKRRKGRGTITLGFEDDNDLDRLMGILERTQEPATDH